MRAALVTPGGPLVPDLAKARRYGITRLYWEATDPQITAPLFDDVRAAGMEVGIMRDPSWDNFSPTALARELDHDLVRLRSGDRQCAILADIEKHDADYVIRFLQAWRAVRPRRETAWTLEPLQGGWFERDLVRACVQADVLVVPQTYLGDMSPVPLDAVRSQLIDAGLPRSRVALFYDAAHIPVWWDGIAFTFAALP